MNFFKMLCSVFTNLITLKAINALIKKKFGNSEKIFDFFYFQKVKLN